MKRYNHAFDIGFSLESSCPTGENVTAGELIAALKQRVNDLENFNDCSIIEAVGLPWDTYEVEDF